MIPMLPLLVLGLVQAKDATAKPVKKPASKPAATAPAKATAAPSAPDAPIAYDCTLVLKGALNTRKSWSKDHKAEGAPVNVEARQDTFEVQIAGTLRETAQKDGSVDFVFEPDNSRPATGSVDATVSTVTPAGSEQRSFKATKFQPMGSFTFHAKYRGQGLYAKGNAFNAIGEATVSLNGGPSKTERRLHDLSPLQDLRKDEKDFKAQALAFTGLSLWALRSSPGNFTAQAVQTYQYNASGLQIGGKVDVGFRIGAKRP